MRSRLHALVVPIIVVLVACSAAERPSPPASGARAGTRVVAFGPGAVTLVGFVDDTSRVAFATPARLGVADLDRGELVREQSFGPGINPSSRAISPDGRHVAFNWGTRAGYEVRLLEVETGAVTALDPVFPLDTLGVLTTSQDGTRLLRATFNTATHEASIQWWALPSGDPIGGGTLQQIDSPSGHVASSPTGDRFALGTHRRTRENPNPVGPIGRIVICDAESNRVLTAVDADSIPRAMVFSPDGDRLYWGSDGDAGVHVLDVASGAEITALGAGAAAGPYYGRGGVPGSVQEMAMAPDGSRLLTASAREAVVRVWDPVEAIFVGEVALPAAPYSIAISSDGRQLAVGMQNGEVLVAAVADATGGPPR